MENQPMDVDRKARTKRRHDSDESSTADEPPTKSDKRKTDDFDIKKKQTNESDEKSPVKRDPAPPQPPQQQEAKAAHLTRRQGILRRRIEHMPGLINPQPITYVTVDPDNYDPVFTALYRTLVRETYRGMPIPANIITVANFTRVCRYLLKSRVDFVYTVQSGKRTIGRIPMARQMLLPKALADIINCIGPVIVDNGTWIVCPKPAAEGNDSTTYLVNATTQAHLEAFSHLTQAAAAIANIRTTVLGGHHSGTRFWITRVTTANNAIATGNAERVIVRSVFPDCTPADAMMAAIVQNQYDGALPTTNGVTWTLPALVDVLNLRDQFFRNS